MEVKVVFDDNEINWKLFDEEDLNKAINLSEE